jgi:hypothetical protein
MFGAPKRFKVESHRLPPWIHHRCQCCGRKNTAADHFIVWTRDGNRRWWYCSELCAKIGKPPLPSKLQIRGYAMASSGRIVF